MTTQRSLTMETLYACVSALTGIPADELGDGESLLGRLPQIEAALRSHLIGQERAVAVAIAALRARLLRRSTTRPVLCLLCAGPSGVGKTELARQLAHVCLGNPDALVRIDCSAYNENHSLSKLIGAPPGYIGHGPGPLTEAVRRRPRSVVLFDECEKAAPEVLNLLLQVMSAGRLTDGMGTTVDFRQTLVILTSNLGNAATGGQVPGREAFATQVTEAVQRAMPPELLGRMDAVVVFHHLDRVGLEEVVRLKLAATAETLHAVDAFVTTPEAVAELAQEAWSPDSGARKIDDVIRERVDPGIVALIKQGQLDPRQPSLVRLSFQDGAYLFERI